MCRYDDVYTDCTGQLCQTGNRHFYLFACGHDQVGKLINHQYNKRQVFVAVIRIQAALDELVIVFFNVTGTGIFQ
ncbi:hypothetical protein D9M68_880020 [compost metagenome]